MEFLRFGSNIPGNYWGCCAIDIIQNFKVDPDTPASIGLVHGDSGTPMMKGDDPLYAGPTYRDIFNTRIRIGTFSTDDMPNHMFLASLTQQQIDGEIGKKWLAILKENGFEFLRTTDNSVYTGSTLEGGTAHPVHLFGLFRNVGQSKIKDPFTPPKGWTDLPEVIPEAWQLLATDANLAARQTAGWERLWNKGKTVLLTAADLIKAKAPIIRAGITGTKPEDITSTVNNPTKTASLKGATTDRVAA